MLVVVCPGHPLKWFFGSSWWFSVRKVIWSATIVDRTFHIVLNSAGANLIDFNNEFDSYEELEPVDQVAQMWNQLNTITLDDKARLAKEMGVAEDFPTA